MDWAVVATTGGGAVSTLLGVVAGSVLGRRGQERHWARESRAAAYRALLQEYSRVQFELRRAYLGQIDIREIDWPRWGAAVLELTLVADEPVAVAAGRLEAALVPMDRYVHAGDRDDDHWNALLRDLTAAQLAFVNAARRSLGRRRALATPAGGPLITG